MVACDRLCLSQANPSSRCAGVDVSAVWLFEMQLTLLSCARFTGISNASRWKEVRLDCDGNEGWRAVFAVSWEKVICL